jgi:hypothetical protein
MDSLKGLKENDRKMIWENRYTAITKFPERLSKVLESCQCLEPNATGKNLRFYLFQNKMSCENCKI